MGHAKAPKAKAAQAPNIFGNTNQSTFGSDFGNGQSTFDPATGAVNTTSSLSPDLQQSRTTAGQGLNTNLGYLAQSPDQVYGQMTAGNNPYYNMLQEQTRRANDANIANARLMGGQLGGANSTALGSEMGRINADNALQQSTNASNAFTLGQNAATGNAGTLANTLTGLANMSYPLGSAANSNLMGAKNTAQQTYDTNANLQNSTNLANLQSQIGTNQQNAQTTGGMINTGLTAAGMIAAPFTGGASLMLPSLLGSSGSIMGSGMAPYSSNPFINNAFSSAAGGGSMMGTF